MNRLQNGIKIVQSKMFYPSAIVKASSSSVNNLRTGALQVMIYQTIIVERNCFAFNPARINVGSIARLTTFNRGIVSPMYICFRTKDNLFPEYLDYYFESKQFFTEIQKRLEGSVRQCLSYEGLCNIPLCIPTVEVQQQTGKRLSTLVQEIKLEIDFLELLQKQKKFLLHQMFI